MNNKIKKCNDNEQKQRNSISTFTDQSYNNMKLNTKQWCNFSRQQLQQFSMQEEYLKQQQQCTQKQRQRSRMQLRVLRPSLLNKSSIQTLNVSNRMLDKLLVEDVSQFLSIQKLDISHNIFTVFPIDSSSIAQHSSIKANDKLINKIEQIANINYYCNLKQICMNDNQIQILPTDIINSMQSLRILRANNNNISIIPYLQHIRHLQLISNPIKLITKRLSLMPLQVIDFDWIVFLVSQMYTTRSSSGTRMNDQAIVNQLCDIIHQIHNHSLTSTENEYGQYIDFFRMFEVRKIEQGNGLQIQHLLYITISQKHQFFIQFLKSHYDHLNYNQMIYNNANCLLLECALEQKYEPAMSLFRLRKLNISDAEVYMANLILVCRFQFNRMEMFSFIIGNGLKRHVIQSNQQQIIEVIIKNFDQLHHSGYLLQKVVYLANFNKHNNKIFHLPKNYTMTEAGCISDGIIYIMNSSTLNQIFNFDIAVENDILEPLLHFAMAARKPMLVKLILQRYRKPFIRNFAGKLAKSIRGSPFSRKLVWKEEKKFIAETFDKNQRQSIQNPVKQSPKIWKINNSKWIDIIHQYDKKQSMSLFSSNYYNENSNDMFLMGSGLKQIQRKAHKRKTYQLKKMSHQLSMQQFQQLDQTGILFDFALKSNKQLAGMSVTSVGNIRQQEINNFSLYEIYHAKLLQNYEKDYHVNSQFKIQFQPIPNSVNSTNKTQSYFAFPSLGICQDVNIEQQNKQCTLTLSRKEETKQTFLCRSPCQEFYTQINEVTYQPANQVYL